MRFTDTTLENFIRNGERKAALILAGRQTIGYRDAALNCARLVLADVQARVDHWRPFERVCVAYRNEFSRWCDLLETARWTLDVFQKTA